MKTKLLLVAILLITSAPLGKCQETVFSLGKSDLKLADEYFENKEFQRALNLYTNTAKKNSSAKGISLKIARCYFFLKQYSRAVAAFEKGVEGGQSLPMNDIYYYAEALSAISNYQKAIEYYRQYLNQAPDDQVVIKKIWRLNNIRFLYEDSLHFAVRPIQLNTSYGELCPAPYKNGIVFMSNRKEVQLVEKVDASLNLPFYRIFYSAFIPDTVNIGAFTYGKPVIFSKELNSRFHAGPVRFYDRGKKIVFASTSDEAHDDGSRTLQLFFASEQNGSWKVTSAFPHNSIHYSVTDPAISEDGRILFFTSDMKGGFGGKDIYRSEYINNQWTKPVNLGEHINTIHDEGFPYLHHNKTLYFSSNGHPGMGGLDIFKADMNNEEFDEAQNAGYPINSHGDEFGIVIDSLSTHGYFSSNRIAGGYNDDIYEFDMDLQLYPLVISGLIRFKEHNWNDSSELKILGDAKLYLVDNIRNVVVHESMSDASGNFSITIPYFSKYIIKVVKDHDENMVSLEIPKHRKEHTSYEIVVVKDAFKSSGENEIVK